MSARKYIVTLSCPQSKIFGSFGVFGELQGLRISKDCKELQKLGISRDFKELQEKKSQRRESWASCYPVKIIECPRR